MRYLIAAVAMLATSLAFAQKPADLSWINATQNTDGSTIPATGAGSLARAVVSVALSAFVRSGVTAAASSQLTLLG